ncbi:hypothetical protein AOA59_27270 [Pseudomonas sp. 2822-15]|nr:hypothetical protein AOA59_27270 [Pseudomonas sp. 2822-15]
MKTSPFERGDYFISSDDRNKKPGAGPGLRGSINLFVSSDSAEFRYRSDQFEAEFMTVVRGHVNRIDSRSLVT